VINGSGITDNDSYDIDFQEANGTIMNIRFADGTRYGFTTGGVKIEPVWNLKGVKDKPIIRIVITELGDVSIFVSKYNASDVRYQLLPMIQIPANQISGNKSERAFNFKKVNWKNTGINDITVVTTILDLQKFMDKVWGINFANS